MEIEVRELRSDFCFRSEFDVRSELTALDCCHHSDCSILELMKCQIQTDGVDRGTCPDQRHDRITPLHLFGGVNNV